MHEPTSLVDLSAALGLDPSTIGDAHCLAAEEVCCWVVVGVCVGIWCINGWRCDGPTGPLWVGGWVDGFLPVVSAEKLTDRSAHTHHPIVNTHK